jgi:hypothetical protein
VNIPANELTVFVTSKDVLNLASEIRVAFDLTPEDVLEWLCARAAQYIGFKLDEKVGP